MKAMVYSKYGSPDVLQLKDVDKPVPADNEVLVKIYATSVTSGDWKLRKADPFIVRMINGLIRPKKTVLGNEFAGIVEVVGKEVTRFEVGDAVYGMKVFGAYAEYLTIWEEAAIALKPAGLSFKEAAVVPNGATTALYFLRKAKLDSGDKILINGASGSVGSYAVQLAKHFGAEVTGVCGSANLEMVASLGADKVIDYTKQDFTREDLIYDVIFDTVGKTSYGKCKKILSQKGRYITTVVNFALLLQSLRTSIAGRQKVKIGIAQDNYEDLVLIRNLIEQNELKPVIDRSYNLSEIPEAHRYVEKGHKKGNVVITVAEHEADHKTGPKEVAA